MLILVINSGSSSIKFKLFKEQKSHLETIASGLVDAIQLPTSKFLLKTSKENINISLPIKTYYQGVSLIFKYFKTLHLVKDQPIDLITHRVVHGGEKYNKPILLNKKILQDLKKFSKIAPLHNPANIKCIEACSKKLPQTPQAIIFDTAFHSTLPKEAYLYGIPLELYDKYKIRKYGFHGINHQYLSEEATKLLKKSKFKYQKLITVHLGNGCSVTAIQNGKSIDTSMGYTPLEGLIMGTRSGDIDPALIPILNEKLKFNTIETINFLNKKSGLLGLSQISSDMRIIYKKSLSNNKKAILALNLFCRRIAKYINQYIGVMSGVDAIVFSGGIGENAFYVRKNILNYLKYLDISLNQQKNKQNSQFITSVKSKIKVLVITANEENAMARQSLKLITAK